MLSSSPSGWHAIRSSAKRSRMTRARFAKASQGILRSASPRCAERRMEAGGIEPVSEGNDGIPKDEESGT
jgi:hypothetical protein